MRYALLPGFLPRILTLFTSGFGTFAFYIANIFGAVRILPYNHPYLQPQNYQKFGLISVLAEGARNVSWDMKHKDQVAAYLIILTAFVTLLMQFLLLVGVFLTQSAFAAPNDLIQDVDAADGFRFIFEPHFVTGDMSQDYALRLLDLVFGLQMPGASTDGFFNSCISTAVACQDFEGTALPDYDWPQARHAGFHSMIHFYNYTIIALAFVILFYYVVTMAAETTVHGTFWGQRGNKTWIPVRVVFFCALILPFYQGFNLAQIITLDAAYFGTGMASNAWREMNTKVGDNLAGAHDTLIAPLNRDNFPKSTGVVNFMSMVHTCRTAEQRINGRVIDAYIVKHQETGFDNCRPLVGTSYAEALEFSNREDVTIRFGERIKFNEDNAPAGSEGESVPCTSTNAAHYADMPTEYSSQAGYVIPYCGEITIVGTGEQEIVQPIKAGNYNLLVVNLWNEPIIRDIGVGFTESGLEEIDVYSPDPEDIADVINARDTQIHNNITVAVNTAITSTPSVFDIAGNLADCGWMCAALYYNRIAEVNGLVAGSVFHLPEVSLYPSTSETVLDFRGMTNRGLDVCDMFNPALPGEQAVDFSEESNLRVASIISSTYEYMCQNDYMGAGMLDGTDIAFRPSMSSLSNNPVIDTITAIFGLNGLFDMRENVNIHPLAQLSLLGKGMVESTIAAFGGAAVGSLAGFQPIARILGETTSTIAGQLTGVMTSLGLIGLTIGFVLYYVLPYLPFIYFLFAAANWIKAIFEAMVGLPLWALAHLRLDGEGIIGEAAADGYWLILEIFLRPFMILVGLMASILIFSGMVRLLNEMFDLVVANTTGFQTVDGIREAAGAPSADNPDPFTLDFYRSPIDQFFYTVIYAIIVYMMALSSFKLIDYIPNEILRWAGRSVTTFGDFQEDHSSQIISLVGKGVTAGAILGGGSLGKIGANSNITNALRDTEQ